MGSTGVCFREESVPAAEIMTPLGAFSFDGAITSSGRGIDNPETAIEVLYEVFEMNYSFFHQVILKKGYNDAVNGVPKGIFLNLPEKQRVYSKGYDYGLAHPPLAGPRGKLPNGSSRLEQASSTDWQNFEKDLARVRDSSNI